MKNAKGKIEWDCTDNDGKEVPNGIYLYKLYDNGKSKAVKKCLLLK